MSSIQSMTGFKKDDIAVNDFSQKVKVTDISRGEIVFEWIGQDSTDTMKEDEFDKIFTKEEK